MKIIGTFWDDRQHGIPKQTIRIMKLTILIMTLFLIQVSAKTNAQITIREKNITLQKVLDLISTQSGYDFVYSNTDFKNLKPVSITLNNATVQDALKAVFNGQPLVYEVSEKTVMVKRKEEKETSIIDRIKSYLASINIAGTVQDEKGIALPGVNVKIKNGKGNTLTGTKGEFQLKNVEPGAIVEFTYVGYKKKEVPAEEMMGFIRMELSDNKLDEVQIQFSGTTSRRTSTSNIATIKAEDIAKQPVDNPLYALMGRVPGLIVTPTSGNPNSPVKVQLRGQNSLSTIDSEPLFIIDGVPFNNNIGGGQNALTRTISGLSFINPSDIESIDVLKDADATAIYGSRGGNGVILITTKKGRTGPTQIDANINFGFSFVPSRAKLLNTQQYLQLRKEAFVNDGLPVPNPSIPDGEKNATNFDLSVWDQNRYTDWQKVLLDYVGKNHDASLVLSGGNDFFRYSVSGNYNSMKLPIPGDNKQETGSGRFNLSGNSLNRKLQISITGSYGVNNSVTPNGDFTDIAFKLAPNAPALYNQDGSLNWEPNPGSPIGEATWTNPMATLLRTSTSSTNTLNTSVNLSYQLLTQLKINISAGYNKISNNRKSITPIESMDPAYFAVNTGTAELGDTKSSNWSFQPQLNYVSTVGKGKIDVIIGGSIQANATADQLLIASGYTNDALLGALSAAGHIEGYSTGSQYKYAGGFGRLNYNWDERYVFNINARRDGSSRFGPGYQYGNFGSIGGAWIFSNEKFVKDESSLLSFGKLRTSYGTNGNDQIGDYRFLELFGPPLSGIKYYQGRPVIASSGATNPDYHWEHKKSLEFGLDLGFFKDRLFLSGSYFRAVNSDQVLNYALPATAGSANGILLNQDAKIQNTGFEFSFTSANIKKKNFTWTTSANLSFANKNKILALPNDVAAFQSRLGNIYDSSKPANELIGKPFGGIIAAYEYRGIDPITGLPNFSDANGNILNGDGFRVSKQVDLNPKYYGGISNRFTFAGISLDIFMEFKKQLGRGIYQSADLSTFGQLRNMPIQALGRWQTQGDVASLPKMSQNGSNIYSAFLVMASDYAYVDASYLRVKNIALSYELPDLAKQKLKLRSLLFFVNAQNILTISGYKGADPEAQSWTVLPPLKVIQTGIRIGL